MNAMTAVNPTIVEAALNFLRRNNLEADFQRFCELARECYPEIVKQRAELWDDADEPDLQYVLVVSWLPKDHPVELAMNQRDEFRQRRDAEWPAPIWLRMKHRACHAAE